MAQQARKAEATREALLCYKVRTLLCARHCKEGLAGTGKAPSSLPENAGRATVGSRAASMCIGIAADSVLPHNYVGLRRRAERRCAKLTHDRREEATRQ